MINNSRNMFGKQLKDNVFIILIILGCTLYLLNLTWLKWGDLIIDSGRAMYVPLALAEGKVLYKDISYVYGPFAPYLHGFIFRIFSPHLKYLILSGIISILITAMIIYKISKIFLDTIGALLVTLTFLFVFAFGKYMYAGIFNFVIPYTYSATYSILFALFSLYLFIRFLYFEKQQYIFGYTFFLSLCLLCRFEIGLSLLAVFIFSLIIKFLTGKEKVRVFYSMCLTFFLPLFITAIVFGLLLFKIGSWGVLKNNFLDTILANFNKGNIFITTLAGYNATWQNVLLMLKSSLAYILVFISLLMGSYFLSFGGDEDTKLISRSLFLSLFKKIKERNKNLSVLIGLSLIVITLYTAKRYLNPTLQYRCLPVICGLITIALFFKLLLLKNRNNISGNLSLLALCLFSWILILRIILNVQAGHYGFYLLIPGMILYYIFFLRLVPDFFKYKNSVFYGAFIILFILLIANHLGISRFIYRTQTLPIQTERGTLYYFGNNREKRCKELVEFLKGNTREDDTVAVFPEGAAINFLSGRDNPIYYYQLLPYDLMKEEVEADVINQLRDKKVSYIAIIQRSTAEYGSPSFGIDYGQKLFNWINENYKEIKLFGPKPFTTNDFGIALLKKNSGK